MRLFTAVRHSHDPNQFHGQLWSRNFYPALRALGHEILESQIDLLPVSRFMDVADCFTPEELERRSRTTEQILDEVRGALRHAPVHLFLSYFYNAHFDPAGFEELRRLGVPSVNFYCNSIHQFANVAAIAGAADFSWHSERQAHASYLAAGAKPVWVQMGADPELYRPVRGVVRQPKASFVGQRYADRGQLAAALLSGGVPIDLYGAGWQGDTDADKAEHDDRVYLGRIRPRPGSVRSYSGAMGAEIRTEGVRRGLARIIRRWHHHSTSQRIAPLLASAAQGRAAGLTETLARYEVVINFSNVWADGRPGSRLMPHVRLRDFEAPMSRACYLTGHTDEIEAFYDIGREIDTYRTPEELKDKALFYLTHPEAAETLREAGYLRALRDHTWKRRFEELFSKIGMTA